MAEAYEIPGQQITFEADADLSTKQFYALVQAADGQVAIAGADAQIVGVLQNRPKAIGHAATVMINGTTKAIAGAAIAARGEVVTDATGRFIPIGAGTKPVGMALTTAAAAGEVFTLLLK